MKKYVSIALVFVVVLFVTAMIIRGSNDSEEVYDEFVQPIAHNDSPLADSFVGQQLLGLEIPRYDFEVIEQIMVKRGFTVSFNPNTKLPNWVAYELTAEETDGPWTRKGLRFMPDPDCNSKQADNNDYRNSGYSRGHLAPAGDMKWDSVAMLESFYFTNCIPQDEALNNGRWNQLEMKTRALARKYGKVYVVCGPVFIHEDTLRIGHNGVSVPDACFKALLIPKDNDFTSIAFIMRNGGEYRSLKECGCTVDELEALLGLDLFCNLPDDVEESIETKVIWEDWGLR
ncbi:MAG: DNA/RNA non-specific endonuclease [Bacteroidales bacterium]|nr:DNA/RNA non-specific endonuclease [Bacteroidales bacterium]